MNLKPLHADVLITPIDNIDVVEKASNSPIIIVEKERNGMKAINYFEVLAVGPEVKTVKKGDKIALKFSDHMVPVQYGEVRISITSEDRIIGILEN